MQINQMFVYLHYLAFYFFFELVTFYFAWRISLIIKKTILLVHLINQYYIYYDIYFSFFFQNYFLAKIYFLQICWIQFFHFFIEYFQT